jgi:hypothetical protein
MPFHHSQATPSSSHLPPMMADRRLPSISIPPPQGPYSHTNTDYHRVLPPPLNLNLPPIQPNPPPVNHTPTNFAHRYLPAPAQFGSNVQAHTPHAQYNAASFQGSGSSSNAASSSSAPIGNHHAPMYGGYQNVGNMGNVVYDQLWINRHLIDLEIFSRNYSGDERGKVYLGLWLGIRELGIWRDKENVRLYIAKTLMPYPWFEGDESVSEALRALHRLEFINYGLLAKKHNENANWFWDKQIGDRTVREFWLEQGRKQRQNEQAQAHAQAQAQAQAQARSQAHAQR